ncbi:MAG: adenylate/guanylate cyclase domain-containing protein [Acidimicrobiia bacterium]
MTGAFPDVRYADADGVSIAYCVRGNGPNALVRVPDIMSSILVSVVDPWVDAFDESLAAFARVIRLDRRGLGMSDPLVSDDVPPLEQQVDDVLAVMDAVGVRRAALHGGGDGAQVALLLAATHPDRVSALVLNNAWARAFRSSDYPFGADPDAREELGVQMRSNWGDLDRPWGLESFAPSRRDDPSFSLLLARRQQVSASPAAASAVFLNEGNDVREILPLVQAPTLVLCPADSHPKGATLQLYEHARFLAEHLPNARLAPFAGIDTYQGANTPERAAMIEEFLTGTRSVPVSDRILATVLFTDIVSSTERLAALGDRAWSVSLDRHDAMVRSHFQRFHGREINTAGDGFFAVFDGPARAVRCAQAISDAACMLGIDVRAGVHAGECEVRGDDLVGIAVHIGARVCALAQPGEVLVTSTVRDLIAGSGVTFTDRGTRTLKGVPGEWKILAAES